MRMSLYPVSPVANRAILSNFKGRAKMLAVWMISMLEVHAGDVRRIQMTFFSDCISFCSAPLLR